MDSKILCISLLLAVFCLWSTEASPLEEHGKHGRDIEYHTGAEDTRSAINEHTTRVASHTARAYANKAKATEAEAKVYGQLAKDRHYYAREYTRLAEEAKKRYREYSQLADMEGSRIGQHLARQKEWESKSREAETQCKDEDLKAQQFYSKSKELRRESVISLVQAAIHEAQAAGYHMKADKANDMSRELRRRAETLTNDARNHYTRGKEDESRATAEKVKAHQQAEDSQKHHAASRAYQQEALRTRLASRSNIMKYIQNSLHAERAHNMAREEETKSEMKKKLAQELATMSENSAAISKILYNEQELYASKAKQDEQKSYEYSESKRVVGSDLADTGELLYMAQAKDESPDEEGDHSLPIYPAEDPIKAFPSEDKNPMLGAGEGLS